MLVITSGRVVDGLLGKALQGSIIIILLGVPSTPCMTCGDLYELDATYYPNVLILSFSHIVTLYQEIIYRLHWDKHKIGSVVHKIDLAKACDIVAWEFLKDCLIEMAFPPLLIKLIMNCVTSMSLTLLWNGNRLSSFLPTKGLRRGSIIPRVICYLHE